MLLVPQSLLRVQGDPGVPLVVPPRQIPAVQVWPAPQRLLQKPQLATSVCVFTHTPEHMVIGLVQVLPPVQRPLMHACAEGHTLPHAPQLVASKVMSVQRLPHMRRGVAQVDVVVHVPLVHC